METNITAPKGAFLFGMAGYPTWVITLRCPGVEGLGFRPRLDISLEKFTQKVDNPY